MGPPRVFNYATNGFGHAEAIERLKSNRYHVKSYICSSSEIRHGTMNSKATSKGC